MEKQCSGIIILLSVLMVISIGLNAYQYQDANRSIDTLTQEKNQLVEEADALVQEKDQLAEEVSALTKERNSLADQASESDYKFNNLDSKINEYLEADGRKCGEETEACLDELTDKLTTKSGPDCSPIADDVCPRWCAASADNDCCTEMGNEWIQGRGCYSKTN